MKRMWSSRIWIICSQMLYWGLLLEDVHVQLEAKQKRVSHQQDGRRRTAWVAKDICTAGTKDSAPAAPRSPARRQGGIRSEKRRPSPTARSRALPHLSRLLRESDHGFSLSKKLLSENRGAAGFRMWPHHVRTRLHTAGGNENSCHAQVKT